MSSRFELFNVVDWEKLGEHIRAPSKPLLADEQRAAFQLRVDKYAWPAAVLAVDLAAIFHAFHFDRPAFPPTYEMPQTGLHRYENRLDFNLLAGYQIDATLPSVEVPKSKNGRPFFIHEEMTAELRRQNE